MWFDDQAEDAVNFYTSLFKSSKIGRIFRYKRRSSGKNRSSRRIGTLNPIGVSSLDESIKKIEQCGGKIFVPKMAIPKIGWLAYAQDPAENVFGIIEADAT